MRLPTNIFCHLDVVVALHQAKDEIDKADRPLDASGQFFVLAYVLVDNQRSNSCNLEYHIVVDRLLLGSRRATELRVQVQVVSGPRAVLSSVR